jgi:hypothetical protein
MYPRFHSMNKEMSSGQRRKGLHIHLHLTPSVSLIVSQAVESFVNNLGSLTSLI